MARRRRVGARRRRGVPRTGGPIWNKIKAGIGKGFSKLLGFGKKLGATALQNEKLQQQFKNGVVGAANAIANSAINGANRLAARAQTSGYYRRGRTCGPKRRRRGGRRRRTNGSFAAMANQKR